VRSGQLHQSLHAFAAEAAQALTAATAGGAEVGFEVVEERARAQRPALYCYRPLTGAFIARNWHLLRSQPSATLAISELAAMPGLRTYLTTHAIGGDEEGSDEAETALRCFAGRVFDGCDKTFLLTPERFEPAYRELYENAVEQRTEIALLGLLRGVSTRAKEIAIGEGMLLAPLERLGRVPPDPDWARDDRPSLVVAVDPGEGPDGAQRALAQMLELQSAMRLYAGGISLAPLAWIHSGGSQWRALPLGGGGRTDGKVALVGDQREELCGFIATVARRKPTHGALGWALRRFELGCEREDRLDGLTDHLLALRALLEPEGASSGRVAGRLAALCADGPRRSEMTRRILEAIALEQALMAGGEIASAGGEVSARAIAAEVEELLRQVLNDVIVGALHGDLVALADARIYQPEADPGGGHDGEFQLTRTSTGAFASELFATPQTGLRPGVSDTSVFEPPTAELRAPASGV
jgi:hypothetical protein